MTKAPISKAAAALVKVRFRAPDGLIVPGAEPEGAYLCLRVPDGGAAVDSLVRAGVPLDDLEVRSLSLEEALAARRSCE